MSFVSYAQNFEDVMLWRALKHIEHGFYIDIGAWSPDVDSVTRAFYERGWRGINVEPNPEFNGQLQARRLGDRNLRMAVGDYEGVLTMNFLSDSGLSTLDDATAERHVQAGWNVERQEVQVTTLSTVWQKYVSAGQEVHFLKVDVEGFEEAALRGNDWSKYRPWIVVVEATLPLSQVESHQSWEPILCAANYRFAYADGLNRFYVADEHSELLPALKYPPNVFDGFLLIQQGGAKVRIAAAEARALESHAQAVAQEQRAIAAEQAAQHWRQQANDWHQRANHWHEHVLSLHASTSWRMTRPLRAIKRLATGDFSVLHASSVAAKHTVKQILRPAVTSCIAYAYKYPALGNRLKTLAMRFPWVYQRLRQVAVNTGVVVGRVAPNSHGFSPGMPSELQALPPRARQIYLDLKAAIENKDKGAA
jgi:FkbM family methyltransferase